MAHSASVAAQRLDVLEAEVARLRRVIEERPASPAPQDDGEHYISVAEAARLARVTTQTVRNWIDKFAIGRFVDPVYLVDRRLLRDHLIRHRGKLPPE
jgi:hypothetical protein